MPIGTIFAGFKFAGLIGKFFNFIGGLFAKLLEIVVKYPIQAAVIAAICLGAWFLNGWAYDRGAASKDKEIAALKAKIEEQSEQLGEYQLQASERGLKIEALEKSSKEAGEQAKKATELANKQFAATVNSYEKKLADAKKNPTIKFQTIYVEVPGKTGPIQVDFEDGVQVCKQYPSGYAQTVNELVRIANETMTKGATQ